MFGQIFHPIELPPSYPDCASTVYSTRVTTAPFRKCDPANMGLSRLCKLSSRGGPVPQKWGDAVLETYKVIHLV